MTDITLPTTPTAYSTFISWFPMRAEDSGLYLIIFLMGLFIVFLLSKRFFHTNFIETHDKLTTLPNRDAFLNDLDIIFKGILASKKETFIAVLMLDIDNFKSINDTLGHTLGDDLLTQVSKRLSGLRFGNHVYRMGADEFGLFFEISPILTPNVICTEIIKSFAFPFIVNNRPLHITVSIGVAIFTTNGATANELLRCADLALFAAKKDVSSHFMIYNDAQHIMVDQFSLVNDLHLALERDSLVLHYQLKRNIKTNAYVGIEALIRLNHPTLGLLYPDTFIHVAETHGLMIPITLGVIKQCCIDLAYLEMLGFKLSVAINISPYCIFQATEIETIKGYLSEYKVDPSKITFEITESAANFSQESFLTLIKEFNALGVKLSIDDFGTGHSSLLYLKSLPIKEIKVDKSFVMSMLLNDQDYYIVNAVVQLAIGMGCDSVAEGVESLAIEEALAMIGCTIAQGYYISKPIELPSLIKLLRQDTQPIQVV